MREAVRAELMRLEGVHRVWQCRPVYFVARGKALFDSAAEMVRLAEEGGRLSGGDRLGLRSGAAGTFA